MSASTSPVVLVADDDEGILHLAKRFIGGLGFKVVTAADGREALALLPTARPDVAFVDLQMPHADGLEVLRAMRQAAPECQVILMTAHPTLDTAIEAVKLGALDYLAKPFDFDRIRGLLTGVTETVARRRELFVSERKLADQLEFCGMIGRSVAMQELFDTIRRLAPHVRTALITGETGSGKELVARALNQVGPRRNRRFMAFNCSAVVETLVESEFFGHARGAFTGATDAKPGLFEAADGGTLFLDEIGELPAAVQAKLLRVIEHGEVQRVGATEGRHVDVRVIAATNRELREEVRLGRFREDLYYRLNVVELRLPPLRDRREDIPYMTAAFVREFAKRFQKPLVGLSSGAERLLQQAPWPGNVRELRNVLERACMLSDSSMLGERELLDALGGPRVERTNGFGSGLGGSDGSGGSEGSASLTRDQIQQTLQQVGGNRSAAARALGMSRRALYRRLDAFRLR